MCGVVWDGARFRADPIRLLGMAGIVSKQTQPGLICRGRWPARANGGSPRTTFARSAFVLEADLELDLVLDDPAVLDASR